MKEAERLAFRLFMYLAGYLAYVAR